MKRKGIFPPPQKKGFNDSTPWRTRESYTLTSTRPTAKNICDNRTSFPCFQTKNARQDKNKRSGDRAKQQQQSTHSQPFPPKLLSYTITGHIDPAPPSRSLPSHNVLSCGRGQCVQTTRPTTDNSERKQREARSEIGHKILRSLTEFSL